MAVFVSASDESDGGHHRSKFWYGGWVMPKSDWEKYFAPAWQERVLRPHPKIPFLHMTDIRNPEWLRKHSLTWDQAQEKMDDAAVVIDQMGSLYPIAVGVNGGSFLDAHGKKKVMQNVAGTKGARFLVDHYSFNAYVLAALNHIYHRHPDAEKVDFIVERKEGVSEKLTEFYDTFADSLRHIGRPELVKYLGKLTAVGKDYIPVQAADMLCWHISRTDLGLLKGRDALRAGTIFRKAGKPIDLSDKIHKDLAESFARRIEELEKEDKKPRYRRNLTQT